MANNCIFADGAELNTTAKWSAVSGAVTAGTPPTGFSGSYYFDLNGTTRYMEYDIGANKSELYFAFRYYLGSAGSNTILLGVADSGGTFILSLTRNGTSGYLEIRRGADNGTVIATGTTFIAVTTVYLIEVRMVPLNSGGVAQVWVDSAVDPEIDYSGDTTAGLENIRKFRIGRNNNTNASAHFDDFIVDDTGRIGNKKIAIAIRPTADSVTNVPQFTPSALTNWECVEEVPPSDTDYNSSNTTGHVDGFVCNDMAENVASIYAVSIDAKMAYEGTPTPTHIQLGMRISGADHYSSDISPPVSFGYRSAIWMTNPETTDPFEKSEIDAMELNYKATA